MTKLNTAVLISGSGSNLQSLIDFTQNDPNHPARITLVISNKADAYGLTRAENAGIKTVVISHKDFPSREAFDAEIHTQLIAHNIDIVCLAGFMRILSDDFVNKWTGKMINIHPSLLPAFKGGTAIKDALEAGVKLTGCTVHMVIPEIDSGEILVQRVVDILPNDTIETLAPRIHTQEHIAYPQALKILCDKILKQ